MDNSQQHLLGLFFPSRVTEQTLNRVEGKHRPYGRGPFDPSAGDMSQMPLSVFPSWVLLDYELFLQSYNGERVKNRARPAQPFKAVTLNVTKELSNLTEAKTLLYYGQGAFRYPGVMRWRLGGMSCANT